MVQISGSRKPQKLNSQRCDKTEDYSSSTENNKDWHIGLMLWGKKHIHKILTYQNDAINVAHKPAYIKVNICTYFLINFKCIHLLDSCCSPHLSTFHGPVLLSVVGVGIEVEITEIIRA